MGPDGVWATLDGAEVQALELAWEAMQTGNIGVGAVIADPDGAVVAAGRNRVFDTRVWSDLSAVGASTTQHP